LAISPSFAESKDSAGRPGGTFDALGNRQTTIVGLQANPARTRAALASSKDDGGIQGADPACGAASPNPDCCVAGVGPGCQDETCCNTICDCDPYCCTTLWDALCAGTGFVPGCGATLLCEQCLQGPCDPPTPNDDCANATIGGTLNPGGSIVFSGTLNCATFDCPLLTAGQGEAWGTFDLTADSPVRISYCGSVGPNGPWGNAYIVLTGACPCDVLTFFSSFAFDCPDGNVRITWNNLLAGTWFYPILYDPALGASGDYVITVEAIQINCGDALCDAPLETCANCPEDCPPPPVCGAAGHDCGTTGGPGCDDVDCCCTVCAVDAFCCDVAWDTICVSEALALCTFDPPKNDNCADRLPIGEVCNLEFSTIGATTDGPAHVACEKGFGDPLVNQDIWYNYTASCDGDVVVSLCGSAYDTKLAVYDGCTCDLSDANLIACNDDGCGAVGGPSIITFTATAGSCYKIRVGGFLAASGSGTLTVQNSGVPCGGPTDCPADLNGDNTVNTLDLLDLIEQWGICAP
jgi:hypothetical protein